MSQPEYDLKRRARTGDSRRYACRDDVNVLDMAGRAGRIERRTAQMTETILDDDVPGAPRVRWHYRNFTYECERLHADDAYALPQSAQLFWDAPDGDGIPPSGEIVFEGVVETVDSFYPNTDAFGLSKTSAVAFMTAELVLHTRQFSMFATRSHGGIEQLRHVGDSVRMPWSGRTDHARNGEMFDASIVRAPDNRLTFEAVTTRQGLDVAMLTVCAPYDVICPGWGPTHCDFVGHLWVDLATGWLVAGECQQSNYMSGVPLPDGEVTINARFESAIELIPG